MFGLRPSSRRMVDMMPLGRASRGASRHVDWVIWICICCIVHMVEEGRGWSAGGQWKTQSRMGRLELEE